MDLLLLIILIGLVIIALGIGFLLGRWMIARKNGLKLEVASQEYNRSKDKLNESNSALMLSKNELNRFKKTSIKEFEKLTTALELTRKELSQAQTDLVKARTVASSDNSHDSTERAQSTDERSANIRRTDEQQSANLAEVQLSARMKQIEDSGGSGHLDTAEVADDFFSVDKKTDESGSSVFFSKSAFSQEGNDRMHEQEALIIQYIEKARIQKSKIDDLLAENEALQQSASQADNVTQSDNALAQSPTDTQSPFEEFVVSDAEDNAAEIKKLKVELQLATQRVQVLSAEVKTLTAEKAGLEEAPQQAPQQATQHDKQRPANPQSETSEHEQLRHELELITDHKEQLSVEVARRISERDELSANVERATLREEKLSSDVESLTKTTETLRKRKDNAELSVEVLRDENASLKKTANAFKEQFKMLQASVPSEVQLKEIKFDKESQQKEILSLTRKLHHADRINNELQQRSLEIPKLESRLEKLDELNTLSERQASQIASLTQSETLLNDQNDDLRLINSEYLNLKRENDDLSRENVKLRAEVDRIPGIINESREARSQVNELTGLVETAQDTENELNEKIEAAQKKEYELNAQIENERKNAAKLDSRIESAVKTEVELRDELEKAQRALTKLDDYHSVTHRLESLQLENRKLNVKINNFDELSANYKTMRDRNDELVDQINQFESKSGKRRNDKSEFLEHNASRQAKDDAQLELVVELTNEKSGSVSTRNAGVKKKVAARSVGKKSPKLVRQNKKKKASVSKLPVNRKAKDKLNLREKDDLKEINGIGPKLEKLLNDHGFSTFEQLAQLSKSESDDLAIKIGTFGERITRDKWVSKAKRLVKLNKKAA